MSNPFSFGGSFDVGKLLGIGGSSASQAGKATSRVLRKNIKYQPELIKAQTQAYRDAGLHPAFIMGGGAGAPVSVGVPDTGTAGQVSFQRIRYEEKQMHEANLRLINKQADYVQEQIEASRASRASNRLLGSAGSAMPIPLEYESAVQTVPISPDRPGELAGSQPAWKTHNLTLGGYDLEIQAPAQETSEIFESMAMWPFVYAANKEAIHRWMGQLMKDKSNIGKLGGIWRYFYEMMRYK